MIQVCLIQQRDDKELQKMIEEQLNMIQACLIQEKDDKKLQKMIEVQLNHEVEQLILDSEKQLTGHPKQVLTILYSLPRLKLMNNDKD